MKKYVLVSGASGGIGKATVDLLLKKGYFVFGIDLVESDIKDENFKFIKCDLTKDAELDDVCLQIAKITTKLDAVLNIAGIFMIQSMIEGSEENLRKILEINFFGAYRLNRKMFPLLDKGSKVLIVSSEVARYSPQPFNGYYALSKILVDKYADILRREFNYLGIKVIKVQSGAMKTKLLDGVNDKYKEMVSTSKLYQKPLTTLKSLMDDEIEKQVDPIVVAYKLVKIVDAKRTKRLYKIRNSFKLRFLNKLPEGLQDYIYLNVIK